VLQGGGALGAYEWGAIEALFAVMDELENALPITLRIVTGVSIGAINGACIVGASGADERERRKAGLQQLEDLWNGLKLETPFRGRYEMPFGWSSISPARDMSLFGLPGFYAPRSDVWNLAHWTSIYDTSALKQTLDAHVCFAAIDESATGFIVSAVDVKRGTLKRFRNAAGREKRLQRPEEDDVVVPFAAEHIMASGSLAPQFPWTRIGTQLYWDGGIVDNTPLGDAMEAFSEDDEVYRLLVVMNLYPLTGREPKNLLAVADRVHELSYGNRLRQDRAAARRINKLLRLIADLAKATKGNGVGKDLRERIAEARHYKIAKTVEVDLQTSGAAQAGIDDEAGLRDFSPDTVELRRRNGRARAKTAIMAALAEDGFVAAQPAPAEIES
jgi:NTE family protein